MLPEYASLSFLLTQPLWTACRESSSLSRLKTSRKHQKQMRKMARGKGWNNNKGSTLERWDDGGKMPYDKCTKLFRLVASAPAINSTGQGILDFIVSILPCEINVIPSLASSPWGQSQPISLSLVRYLDKGLGVKGNISYLWRDYCGFSEAPFISQQLSWTVMTSTWCSIPAQIPAYN